MNIRMNAVVGMMTALVAAGILYANGADAKPIRVGVTAIGSGTDSSKSDAMSAAKDNAKGMLVCTGRLEDVDVTSTGCVKTGSDDSASYVCSAVAKAVCVIGN